MSDEPALSTEERKRRLREIQLPNERKIIKHPDFEIPVPSKVSIFGFIGLWILIAMMVAGTAWIFGLGQ